MLSTRALSAHRTCERSRAHRSSPSPSFPSWSYLAFSFPLVVRDLDSFVLFSTCSANRSNRSSQRTRYRVSQPNAALSGAAAIWIRWTRPSGSTSISPASSRTRRCLEIAGALTLWGSASSLTVASPPESCSRIVLLIGWANDAKIASRSVAAPCRLTIWLSDRCGLYLTFWLIIVGQRRVHAVGLSHVATSDTERGDSHGREEQVGETEGTGRDRAHHAVSGVQRPGRGGREVLRLRPPELEDRQPHAERGRWPNSEGEADGRRVPTFGAGVHRLRRRPRFLLFDRHVPHGDVPDAGGDRPALGNALAGRGKGPVRLAHGQVRAFMAGRPRGPGQDAFQPETREFGGGHDGDAEDDETGDRAPRAGVSRA